MNLMLKQHVMCGSVLNPLYVHVSHSSTRTNGYMSQIVEKPMLEWYFLL